jgi:hypothetical protein
MDINNSTSQEQKDSPINLEVPYTSSTDACTPLGTVVPASMAYEQKRFAEKLRSSIKPSVHEFVMNRLNYTDYKEFCQSFGQEQIDAIANAIYNFENTGFGIIIADQTGVGKGRVGAGLIRYAIEYLNKMPIFVTEKPHLVSDIYRDLIDINYQANVPEQVKVVSMELQDLTDNQIRNLIKKDLDEYEELRIDIGDIIDDVPDDFSKELVTLFGKEPEKAELPDDIEPEDFIEKIVEAYRFHLEVNGLETYIKDWVVSKDNEYVIGSKKGDTYDTILKRELKKGRKLIKPFVTKKYVIKDENGNIIYELNYNKKVEKTQRLDGDLKVVMTTYSQFSTAFEKNGDPKPKFNLLRKIALNGLIILDESHNAAGVNDKGEMSNTARAVADLIQLSKDAIFISATFAKTPKNMFLYAMKTAIQESNLANTELISVFNSGGNALQEATSAELARIGHIVRRQRPIVGKTFYEKQTSTSEIGISQVDSFNIFRELVMDLHDYYRNVKSKYITYLKQLLGEEGYKERGRDYPHSGNVLLMNFNLVNQFLLGLKVEQTSSEAIGYLQDGKKPVIAIANTMESIYSNIKKDYEEQIPYDIGDIVTDDLSLIFPYMWDYCFKYSIYKKEVVPNEDGQPETKRVKKQYHLIHDCSYEFVGLRSEIMGLYNSVMSRFKNANYIGTPLAPIDKIISNIQSAGFTVGEVTGRKRKLVTKDGYATLQPRKVANVTDTIRDFNYNVIDALVLNRSGAVGVSMHAKPNNAVNKFDESILKINNLDERPTPTSLEPRDEIKQRVMIITQMELDVNKEVQKLGRISRTGQIYAPIYKYLTSCVPFEERFAAMMELKLRSLMATVSSDQKGASSLFTAEDYLSEEGGDAVIQPAQSAGIELPRDDKGNLTKEGKELVDYCFKQLYFRTIEQQETFFIQFQKSLAEVIEKKTREGTYNRKMLLKQYNAETSEVLPFELGMENPFSSFGSPVFAERLNIETFQTKNFTNLIEYSISKSLQTIGDEDGNKNAIESLDKYKKYMTTVADKYLQESILVRHNEDLQDFERKIQEAKDSIESKRLEIKGYGNVEEAVEMYNKISQLNDEIFELKESLGGLAESGNQEAMNIATNQIQSKTSEKSILSERFEKEYKEIYDNKRSDYAWELGKISGLEKSIENLTNQMNRKVEIYQEQVLMCEKYKYYISNIGQAVNVITKQESSDYIEDENGQMIKEYKYAETLNEAMILIKVDFPFVARKNTNFTWALIDLTFTPAYGGNVKSNLNEIDSTLTSQEIIEKQQHTTELKMLGYDFEDEKWNNLVQESYTGVRGEKVFLTGSLLRAIKVAGENNLSGNIVKFNTIDSKIRIGYELSLSSSNAILPKFNDTDSFPIVSSFSTSLVKDVILPYIISILQDDYNNDVVNNYTNYQVLLFEVLEKVKSEIKNGVSTIDESLFVEFKGVSGFSKSNTIESLQQRGLDSNSIYVRFSSTTFNYIHTILDFLNVLDIENSSEISDGFARTLAFKTTKRDSRRGGLKRFTVAEKFQSSKWDFEDRYSSLPYYIDNYLTESNYNNYDFSTGNNAFVLTAVLNNAIETKETKEWYSPKFAIDLSLNDFCKLCDYIKSLEMPLKTAVSYKMLKDSGTFQFDIESFQRASIVTDISGEGNIQREMSEEVEKIIDALIDNLVELFQ